jgi:hypothetical protein
MMQASDGTAGPAVKALLSTTSCLYCGTKIKSNKDKRIDHMDPIALGGWHSAANLALACEPCNIKKAAKPFIEWADSLSAKDRQRAVRYYTKMQGRPPEQWPIVFNVTTYVPKKGEKKLRMVVSKGKGDGGSVVRLEGQDVAGLLDRAAVGWLRQDPGLVQDKPAQR